MRKHLLLSTAAISLLIASGLSYAQAPSERRDEPKRTEEPKAAAPRGPAAATERLPERAGGAAERAGRNEAADEKKLPAAAEKDQPKGRDQAQDSRERGRDAGKSSAESKQDKSAPEINGRVREVEKRCQERHQEGRQVRHQE